jgi:hypothetical protein
MQIVQAKRKLLAAILILLALVAGPALADPLLEAAAKLSVGGYSERIKQVEAIAIPAQSPCLKP